MEQQQSRGGLRISRIDETENHSVPRHFFCGPQKLNIILTQLRSSASFLNFDLFRVGIVSGPSCRCGAAFENLKHFCLDYPIYIRWEESKYKDN
jgi:hypothetical protein